VDIELLKTNPDIVRLNPELQAPKRRKFGNVPTEYKGRVYDSSREAIRASELDLLKRAGHLICWFAQVPIDVGAGITYIADFVVVQPDWTVRVEDVKSKATRKIATYRLKRKLFKEKYHREIIEV
jgi:hypothetical protein